MLKIWNEIICTSMHRYVQARMDKYGVIKTNFFTQLWIIMCFSPQKNEIYEKDSNIYESYII
jgi:hypothetical protein